MVRDGYYYALACVAAALLVGWLTALHWLALIPLLLAAFFLWFFRDPERKIPNVPGAIVSIADGKVTDISPVLIDNVPCTRISVFLNVFNVHVNRAPASGVVTRVEMRKGQYKNAMAADSAELNEQSICTMRTDDGVTIIFKQIAGLLARRIVFWPKVGDRLERGQRFGLIKFGSRCDIVFPASANVSVRMGEHVSGGSTVLAVLPRERPSESALPRATESAQ